MSLTLDRIELTDTVSEMVTKLNDNSGATETAVNGIPTYSAGTGININSGAISIANSGATAGSYGPTGNVNGTNGTTLKVPQITINAKGQVTGVTERTYTSVDNNTTYGVVTKSANGLCPILPNETATTKYLRQDGTWVAPPNTTYGVVTKSANGLCPVLPNETATTKYLRQDGSWVAPPNTTYNVVAKSSNGLCPALPNESSTTKYLRQDGTWVVPPDTNTVYSAGNGLTLSGTQFKMSGSYDGTFTATKVYNAVWNDYAEFRESETVMAGRCVAECEDGIMRMTTKRLQKGCKLTSDTFGSCMGETDKAKTPIAVAGRVLVHPRKGKRFKIGDAVCSAPDGAVDVMSRLEVILFPDRIVGIVSEIPEYEEWVAGDKDNPQKIKVNGRIWVYVR